MRTAIISNDHRLIIYRAPKVGATTTLNWLIFGLLNRPHAPKPNLQARAYAKENGHLITGKDVLDDMPGYRRVAIKRDPMDRAISAYVSKFILTRQFVTTFDQLGIAAQQLYCDIRQVDREQAAAQYRGISFVEFLEFITEAVENRGKAEPILNPHWSTQVSFEWTRRGISPDEVHDIRHLNEALQGLSQRYGLAFTPLTRNATNYTDALVAREVANESSRDLALEQIAPRSEAFVTPRTIDLVARAYAIDYETFGYPPRQARTDHADRPAGIGGPSGAPRPGRTGDTPERAG